MKCREEDVSCGLPLRPEAVGVDSPIPGDEDNWWEGNGSSHVPSDEPLLESQSINPPLYSGPALGGSGLQQQVGTVDLCNSYVLTVVNDGLHR